MNEKRTAEPAKIPARPKKRGRGRPPLNGGGGDSATHNIRFANRAWSRIRTLARRRKMAAADLIRKAADELIAREDAEKRETRGDA